MSEPVGPHDDFAEPAVRRRGLAVVASAVAAALVVAGVAVGAVVLSSGDDDERTSPPVVRDSEPPDLVALTAAVPCPHKADDDPPSRDELAAFTAVTAVTCGEDYTRNATDGEWLVRVRKVAVSAMGDLQAAYQLPSESPTNGACTADLRLPPSVILVDADGKWVFPAAPMDECNKPRQELEDALHGLRWQDVWVHKIRQLTTPEAVAADCAMQYKNENWLYADLGAEDVSPGGPVFSGDPGELHVCLYRGADDPEIGDFVRGLDLDADRSARLADALSGAGPTGSCAYVRDFAVVESHGRWANVELGGCWRVTGGEGGVRSADPDVVRRILGLD